MLIELNDLRHSINRALNLGRYQIVVKTAGAEQVPASITLDLLERDDDEYSFSTEEDFRSALNGAIDSAAAAAVSVATDDHGPAAPAQDTSSIEEYGFVENKGPTRYEIQIQALAGAAKPYGLALNLENVTLEDVFRFGDSLGRAGDCDYVHVYDRVTRERRTLKRPEPDAVLAGLQDVAADLRGKADMTALGEAITEVASGAAKRRSSPGKWRVYRDGEKVVYETFDQPPAAEPMPPVGFLTSTEGLKAGDIIRSETDEFSWRPRGSLLRVTSTTPGSVSYSVIGSTGAGSCNPETFAFVARPGAWMPWEGGENPVPGLRVKVKNTFGREVEDDEPRPSERSAWSGPSACTAYMVVDTPPSSSET